METDTKNFASVVNLLASIHAMEYLHLVLISFHSSYQCYFHFLMFVSKSSMKF